MSKHNRFLSPILAASILLIASLPLYCDGQVNVTGDFSPSYDGSSDPWYVGGDSDGNGWGDGNLTIGINSTGEISVTGGSYVSDEHGTLGHHSGSGGNATVSGVDSRWENQVLFIGRDGAGTLTVQNGGRVSSWFGYLGFGTGSSGVATISGAGSRWISSNIFVGGNTVGARGNGILDIVNGGSVGSTGTDLQIWNSGTVNLSGGSLSVKDMTVTGGNFNHSSGELTIHGGGSFNEHFGDYSIEGATASDRSTVTLLSGATWNRTDQIFVGDTGKGALNLYFGAEAQFGRTIVGFNNAGEATIGFDSRLEAGTRFDVGYNDGVTGTAHIDSGGTVNSGIGLIGVNSGSVGYVRVRDTSSSWNMSGDLAIGNNGTGTLDVRNGGNVTNSSGIVGRYAGSEGNVMVSGSGSSWTNNSFLYVGIEGSGILDILDGGQVSAAGKMFIARGDDTNSTVTISGSSSSLTVGSDLVIAGRETVAGGSGTFNIDDGAIVSVGATMKLWDDATVNLTGGTLDVGTLDLTAPTATDDFNMTGGRLVADTIDGDFIQDGGVLAPGDSPGLTEILGDFEFNDGSIEFEIAGLTRESEFDALDITGLATLDGVVDVNLISGFDPGLGDQFDLIDGTIDAGSTFTFDFSDALLASGLTWDTSLFQSDGIIQIAAIPEPATVGLVGLIGAGLLLRRRRRRS